MCCENCDHPVCLCVTLSICLCLSVYLSVCLSVCLSICLSVCAQDNSWMHWDILTKLDRHGQGWPSRSDSVLMLIQLWMFVRDHFCTFLIITRYSILWYMLIRQMAPSCFSTILSSFAAGAWRFMSLLADS